MILKLYPYERLVKMNQLMVIKQTPKLFPRIYRFHVRLEHCMSDTRLSVLQADQIRGNMQFSKPLSCAKATASSQELLGLHMWNGVSALQIYNPASNAQANRSEQGWDLATVVYTKYAVNGSASDL